MFRLVIRYHSQFLTYIQQQTKQQQRQQKKLKDATQMQSTSNQTETLKYIHQQTKQQQRQQRNIQRCNTTIEYITLISFHH